VAIGAVFAEDCAHLPSYGASKLNIFEGQVPKGDLHQDKYAAGANRIKPFHPWLIDGRAPKN
jgi:hypothetical protein